MKEKLNNPVRVAFAHPFVSDKEVAQALGCHRTTVARILRKAGIEACRFGRSRNSMKRYDSRDIERFITGCKDGSALHPAPSASD